MELVRLRVENYKGLREVDIPLSRFACLIGENNAGKSSVLQAISLFFSGSTLPASHYFDPSQSVRVEIALTGITDDDVNRLAEEHREKIRSIVSVGNLTLVRLYGLDGKSSLKYRRMLPRDERFSDGSIDALVKGKRAGQSFVRDVVAQFPELEGVVTAAMNQGNMKEKIYEFADQLPDDQKAPADAALPTGIDASVYGMLPEPIYIQAVKDLKDEVKTTEGTPFGKVLGVLLKAIEPLLAGEQALFEKLNAKLNRVKMEDGTERDERLEPVKVIEATVERFVRESFRAVSLRINIPPPQLKTVLSSAAIFANDGVDGPIETKGDGLRRAIIFAILRSFVELNRSGLLPADPAGPTHEPRYLFLFEEPELFLHPTAQQILFDALGTISQKHPVVVTTHSPAFFGPNSTTTFVKMRKASDAGLASKPFGVVHPIDLGETSARDQFQIICYENNSIAFFADTVVLVEGDSDYIVLPHLARLIEPAWDIAQTPVRFARIGGKGSIRRYREFFSRFGARVMVITDLDFLLGNEFQQVDPSESLTQLRQQLLQAADAIIDAAGGVPVPTAERIRNAQTRGDLRSLWTRARDAKAELDAGRASWEDLASAVEEFFAWERSWARREVLKNEAHADLMRMKRELLEALRGVGVCVLEKGAIEDYYPNGIQGDGKPSAAQNFCATVTQREQALALCGSACRLPNGSTGPEFQAIFETVFG